MNLGALLREFFDTLKNNVSSDSSKFEKKVLEKFKTLNLLGKVIQSECGPVDFVFFWYFILSSCRGALFCSLFLP